MDNDDDDDIIVFKCEYEVGVNSSNGSYSVLYEMTHKQYSGEVCECNMSTSVCDRYAEDFKARNHVGGVICKSVVITKPHSGSDKEHLDYTITLTLHINKSAARLITIHHPTNNMRSALWDAARGSMQTLMFILLTEIEVQPQICRLYNIHIH